MSTFFHKRLALPLAGAILLGAGWLLGQQSAKTEATVLHVFAYTPMEQAAPEDFDNFKKATADMVGKVPGLKRAWVGKLKAPLKDGDETRLYGAAMEFESVKALADYADDPNHKTWEKVYRKVRVAGTTTIDILGE